MAGKVQKWLALYRGSASMLLILLSLTLTVSSCSTSLVQSRRPQAQSSEEDFTGMVYSLPKQLVKVTYERHRNDSDKIKEALKTAQETADKAKAALKSKDTEISNLSDEIKAIDPKAANRQNAEVKLNLGLTMLKAEKVVLTRQLKEAEGKLQKAKNDQLDEILKKTTYTETLEITAEKPVVDKDFTFYARIDHGWQSSDSFELKTENGLLQGGTGYSEDKTGEVIVSLAGFVSAIMKGAAPGPRLFLFEKEITPTACAKKDVVKISQVFDPDDQADLGALNRQLEQGCIEITVTAAAKLNETKQFTDLKDSGKQKENFNGLVYRQPGLYGIQVKSKDDDTLLQTVWLSLAQGGSIGIIEMPKGVFAKNEYETSFKDGMLASHKAIRPSELLGAASILPNALKAIISIPTELIKLKVDYSTSEQKLLELKKAILEAQFALDKKQAELETGLSP